MTTYQAESFYRAKITSSITQAATCPITIRVSKLPSRSSWLLTISPNTEYEEIVEYANPNSTTMTIDITKRWINPSSTLLNTNGTDYNNTLYQKEHTQNDIIRGDVNHIHINQGIGNTQLASASWVGISKLSVAPVDTNNPIAVGDNDPRLTSKETSRWVYDFWHQSWATQDSTYRNIIFFWADWDNTATYTQTILNWLWTTTIKITARMEWWTSTITVPVWKTCRVKWNFYSSNTNLKVLFSWTSRALGANSDVLSTSNKEYTFVNTWASDWTVTLQLASWTNDSIILGMTIEVF